MKDQDYSSAAHIGTQIATGLLGHDCKPSLLKMSARIKLQHSNLYIGPDKHITANSATSTDDVRLMICAELRRAAQRRYESYLHVQSHYQITGFL